MKSLLLIPLLALAGCSTCQKHAKPQPAITESPGPVISGVPFLVISNRTWIDLNGFVILKLTDCEWCILTNAYPTNLSTQTIQFVK